MKYSDVKNLMEAMSVGDLHDLLDDLAEALGEWKARIMPGAQCMDSNFSRARIDEVSKRWGLT